MPITRNSSKLRDSTPARLTQSGVAIPAVGESFRRRIVSLASIFVFAAALSVLLGWQFGIDWLKTPLPGKSFMVPNTALCFLLASLSLWLQRSGDVTGGKLRLARVSAFAVVVPTLQFLAESLFNLDLYIDRIFFHHRLQDQPGGWPAGRPALITSLSLLLLGLCLLLTGRKVPGRMLRGWYLSEILCIPAFFTGYLGTAAYALGAHVIFQPFPAFTTMSVYTAVFVCVLSTGILFSHAGHRFSDLLLSRGPGGVLARRVLPAVAATLLLLGWLGVLLTRSELFDVYMALTILVTAGTFVLAGLVMWTATQLNRDAAERRSAEQSIAYLSALVHWSNDAIIGKTLDGIISSWNRAAETLYGYTAAEVVGRSAEILIPPHHGNELNENLGRLARGEIIPQYETVRQRKNGSVIDVEISLSPIRNAAGEVIGASSIARDVTEAKRAQENLRRAKQEWEQTFNSVPDLIAVLDNHQHIVRVNKALATRLGTTAEACVGKLCYRCVHGTFEPPKECPHTLTLLDQQQHIAEVREELLQGDFVVSTTPFFDEQGKLAGTVHVSRDISDVKRAHEALVRSEKLATTGQLAASIAHEIHNPLDAVGNLLYLVQQSTTEVETRNFVLMATQELNRVTQITHQMLTFQREAAAPVPVKINEVVENVLALYERKIQAAGISIQVEIDPEAVILALPGQTRQVFANLIGNAIEAKAPGDGKIRLRAYSSRNRQTGQEGLRFVIADNGRGIPSELQKKVFDPFFTTKGENGTGLGLWIAQDIVEKSGGSLRLHSTTRQGRSGTCFSLFFPNTPKPSAANPAPPLAC